MNTFKNPNDPDNTQLKSTLKNWISAHLKLSKEAIIDIEEHQCTEASCVHAETLFQTPNTEGGYDVYKIAKPLVFIRKWDIEAMKKSTSKIVLHKH